MASHNDFLSLMPKFSSISLGCKRPLAPDIRSRSLESSNLTARRRARNLACLHCGDEVKPKHSVTSQITYPGGSRERNTYRWKSYNTKMDVRYVREINKYNKPNLQNQPPKTREKVNSHMIELRRRQKTFAPKHFRDQEINVSPTLSKQYFQKMLYPHSNDSKLVQTEITQNVSQPQDNKDDTSLKSCDTADIEPSPNYYKAHLHNEIINWLLTVPVFYSADFTPKKLKNNIADTLAVEVDKLLTEVLDSTYDTKVKNAIDEYLKKLPMWLPNTKVERFVFKNELRNQLYQKIKQLNQSYLNIQNDNDDDDNAVNETQNLQFTTTYKQNDILYSEINNWLNKITFDRPIYRARIIDIIIKIISPLLNVNNHTTNYKLMLKEEIVDVLKDLPVKVVNPRNKNLILNRYAEDLAYRLMYLQIKLTPPKVTKKSVTYKKCAADIVAVPVSCNLKQTVHKKVNKALENEKIQFKSDVKNEICDVILNSIEVLRSGIEINTNNEICNILKRVSNIDEETAMNIAKKIKIYIKIALKQDREMLKAENEYVRPQFSGILSIYRSSIHDPVTSTPKQPKKRDVPRLNVEERNYVGQVSDLIRAWMDTLPTNFDDDKTFKETIISDLAGDIMDEAKLEQMSPEVNIQKDKHLKYFVFRWLVKFDIFDDINNATPFVRDFLNKLRLIPVPQLTASQYGTRQAMANIKLTEQDDFDWAQDFVPKGIDVLEDQISVWMNDQPTEIYDKETKRNHEKLVKNLALILQDHLRNKSPESEIEKDIKEWLAKVVKNEEREHLGLLTQDLKEKVINVPQDKTLEARNAKKQRERAEYIQARQNPPAAAEETVGSVQEDLDKTMKEFIVKYMEHNYDIDDPMARGALAELLLLELRKLPQPARQELYSKSVHEKFNPEKLHDVLEYIKIISDWLKNLPIHPLYNTPGHRPRIDYVNDLARNIQEVEDKRKENPGGMDYDLFINSIITDSVRTYNIPVLPEHKDNIPIMVEQLVSKIVANRSIMDQNNSSNLSDIKEQNLSDFIQDYIRINGREIADDEVKLEAWTARLLEEVKKMINEGNDPQTDRAKVIENFAQVPIPGDESVKRFSSEIAYVKEISDWLKNLPLLTISTPEEQADRIRMITELAQKIAERDAKYSPDPNDNTANKELVEYITNWIPKLPLDPDKEIVIPILIQQLMNRVDKVNKRRPSAVDGLQREGRSSAVLSRTIEGSSSVEDPGKQIVEFIEAWCNKLPISGDPENVKVMKNGIAKNLYQKISELNADIKVINDELLFKDLFEDEIDTQFENIPQDPELQNNKEQLKTELLDTVLNLKNIIKQKAIGDDYKHKLEATIGAAIPNPVQNRQVFEPGFEMYKNHLASMFILENFDHANDEAKTKYENKIRAEVDKYFESALKKNALPMTRDQLYHELYGELFKVPMPKNESVIDKVEEIKTRYEIDAWFDELPVKQTDDLLEQLEWDKILSKLAERIHNIEKNEPGADDKIRKEINKCLTKLPLQPGQEGNVNQYIDKLLDALKASEEARKYVAEDPKGKNIVKQERKVSLNTSQIPGPYNASNIPPPPTNGETKKSGDVIVDIVEEWCNALPLIGTETETAAKKENLSTKIVMKIYELNQNSDICNDDVMYDHLFNTELDKILANVVAGCEFQRSKAARKYQLKEMIKSVIPLMKEEKDRHSYKEDLNNTVAKILSDHTEAIDKIAEFNNLKDEIVDSFVEYNYNKDDDETKRVYKMKLHDAVVKYFSTINNTKVDPLVIRNQLLCELSKVPVPNDRAMQGIVEETKMKTEIERMFDKSGLNDNSKQTADMKNTLTKRLIELEKSGHTEANDKKMTAEIMKCLKKLNKTASPQVINDFVNNLKNNEAERKSLPVKKRPSKGDVMQRRDSLNQRHKCPKSCENVPRKMSLPCPMYSPGQLSHAAQQTSLITPVPSANIQRLRPTQSNFQYGGLTQDVCPRRDNILSSTCPNAGARIPQGVFKRMSLQSKCLSCGNQDNHSNDFNPYLTEYQRSYKPPSAQSSNEISDLNWNRQNYQSRMSDNHHSYDNFRDGHLLSSTRKPDGNGSCGYCSSPSLAQESRYGQTTPRQVQGEAQYQPSSVHEMTPESLYQVPPFVPNPLYTPIRIRIPSDISRRSDTSSGSSKRMNAVRTRSADPNDIRPRDQRYRCICKKRLRRYNSGPFCMIPMDEYCDDCGGFYPMWCRMPIPFY